MGVSECSAIRRQSYDGRTDIARFLGTLTINIPILVVRPPLTNKPENNIRCVWFRYKNTFIFGMSDLKC